MVHHHLFYYYYLLVPPSIISFLTNRHRNNLPNSSKRKGASSSWWHFVKDYHSSKLHSKNNNNDKASRLIIGILYDEELLNEAETLASQLNNIDCCLTSYSNADNNLNENVDFWLTVLKEEELLHEHDDDNDDDINSINYTIGIAQTTITTQKKKKKYKLNNKPFIGHIPPLIVHTVLLLFEYKFFLYRLVVVALVDVGVGY